MENFDSPILQSLAKDINADLLISTSSESQTELTYDSAEPQMCTIARG